MTPMSITAQRSGNRVWITKRRFHMSRDCVSLAGKDADPLEAPVEAVGHREPCVVCFKSLATTLKVTKRPCEVCGHGKVAPCAHNGGVLVTVKVLGEPDSAGMRRWTWPDRAVFAETVDVVGYDQDGTQHTEELNT